jgi:hypothetical protein
MLEEVFGSERKLCAGELFHRTARGLRQPFLDWLARLGTLQCDRIGWWSSSLSWKDSSSELFLLLCYAKLAGDLIDQSVRQDSPLVILVEDPWLFGQLKKDRGSHSKVVFLGRARIHRIADRVRSLALGSLKRLRWLSRILVQYARLARYYRADARSSVVREVGIYSLPQERALVGSDEWRDPYFGPLSEVLARSNIEFFRFGPAERPGFEKDLGRRRKYYWPLVMDLDFRSLVVSFFAFWAPDLPKVMKVDDVPVNFLVKREWWFFMGLASLADHRLSYELYLRFLGAQGIRTLIFPWENQPWEKLLVLAARLKGVKTVGYQHSTVPVFALPHFLGRNEAAFLPLPDRILTSGESSLSVLKQGGVPGDILRRAGSFRHLGFRPPPLAPSAAVSRGCRILVLLPLDLAYSRSMLRALNRAFPEGGRTEGLDFRLRPHPAYPYSNEDVIKLYPKAEMDTSSLTESLAASRVALFDGSTAGVEAWLAGCRVLRFRPELLLDLVPYEMIRSDEIPVCDESNLRQALLELARNTSFEPPSAARVAEVQNLLFSPVDETAWQAAISSRVP